MPQHFVGTLTRPLKRAEVKDLYIYIHNSCRTDSVILDNHCSTDLEYITVKYRLFYFPREFSAVKMTAVYVPQKASVNTALEYLQSAINKQRNNYPHSVHIKADDFNQVDLKVIRTTQNLLLGGMFWARPVQILSVDLNEHH